MTCLKCDRELLTVDGALVDAELGDPNCPEGGHHVSDPDDARREHS